MIYYFRDLLFGSVNLVHMRYLSCNTIFLGMRFKWKSSLLFQKHISNSVFFCFCFFFQTDLRLSQNLP